MRVRLIFAKSVAAGGKSRREEFYEGDVLTLGRNTGSGVHLPGLSVSLDHASLSLVRGKIRIDATDADDLVVNGRIVTSRGLKTGDVVRIGSHELRVIPAADTEDIALEIEQVERPRPAVAALAEQTRLGIRQGFLNPRPLSWIVCVFVLVVFLILPLVQTGSTGGVFLDSWKPGPFAPSHKHFGADCRKCHTSAFRAVPDQACVECHQDTGVHSTLAAARDRLAEWTCEDCHREHRGESGMAIVGDSSCMTCHEDLTAIVPEATTRNVGDFATEHPEFRISVVGSDNTRTRIELGREDAAADSGLAFAHSGHLKGPIKDLNDREIRLNCRDCHRIGPEGTSMRATVFERDCRRCHSLAFDPGHESEEAPHDTIAVVTKAIFRYYAGGVLEGEDGKPQGPPIARRPGRTPTVRERLQWEAWARDRTEDALSRLLGEKGVCSECHSVRRTGPAPEIVPVLMVPRPDGTSWLPGASFSHRAHRTEDCDRCHAGAPRAERESPLLLPSISVCRECHGGSEPQSGRVTSACGLCHRFHRGPSQRSE